MLALIYHYHYHYEEHSSNFHICGIILHLNNSDYGIYSVYKQTKADPNQIFKYPFETDKIIIGGDFNAHHPLWGSKNCTASSMRFVNNILQSNFIILNDKTPTRIDPGNKTETCIDLTLISNNISNAKWQTQIHKPQLSDHVPIIIKIPLDSNKDENLYHFTWNLNSKNKWNKFQKLLKNKLEKLNDTNDINKYAQNINKTINETAIKTIGFRQFKKNYKPCWNEALNEIKK